MICDQCGGPRINGRAVERDPEGGWRPNTGSVNPARPDLRLLCRECARKYLKLQS